MQKYLLIFGTYFIRGILYIFYIFPIKKNRIIFNSMIWKQYSCNPKYITEFLIKKYPNKFEIIWAFDKPENFLSLKEKGIKICKTRSLKFYYYSITSKISICNVTSASEIPKRKGQYRINTWHGGGGGYKKIDYSGAITFRSRLEMKETDLFCASSKTSLNNTIRKAFKHDGDYFKGTPRNDMFINSGQDDIKRKVYNYFKLSKNTKIVLYAPTYREGTDVRHYDMNRFDYGLDYIRLQESMKKRFGENWVVAVRFHPRITQYNIPKDERVVDATKYPDMQELLISVDALVTDYSSSLWDFSFTYKPCFLFCTDLDEYKLKRGFNKPINEWGFPISKDNDSLEKNILFWNKEKHIESMKTQHTINGSFEDGTATARICELILKKCYDNDERRSRIK